jgi:multidrug efflux pump subunit AcrB
LGVLGRDFLIAIFLVLITLLPLGFRASVLVMVAIPLSLALGIIGLNMFGISLNQLSIVGLVVALGLLVDDSIVVVENIERWLRDGYSKKDAAIKATQQIGLAVIATTATLIIAFLPLIFLPDGPGEFVRGLPLAVVCSVFASMLVSLTIVPFLASRFLKPHPDAAGNFFLQIMQKGINATYSKVLAKALKSPKMTLVICFFIFLLSLGIFPIIGFKLFPTSEKPIFLVNVKMPQQTNLEETNRILAMVEDSLSQHPEIEFYTANAGKGNPRIYYNVPQKLEQSDFGQVFIQLKNGAPLKEKADLIYKLRRQFEAFPYAKVEIADFEQGPPVEAPISIRVFGDNLDTLRSIAADIEHILATHPNTIYVSNGLNTMKTDLKVDINREKARNLGVFTSDIDNTVRFALSGIKMGLYTDEDEDYDIVVETPKDRYPTLQTFDNIYINSVQGAAIPLSQVANLNFETSAAEINRQNKNRFARVNAFTQRDALANDILKDIVPQLNAMTLPKGYHYKLAGESETEGDAFGNNFLSVILVSLFLFIAVLVLQFKTFKSLLIVLSVIPLGIVGGISMLYLSGNPMSFVAIIGFIGLAGIEVKNSILLVDFTNQLRQEGMGLLEAIEKAGELRFLPIILTSLTAIGGLIPIALNPNPQISPLALVLIGGLISSTILSRIVTPVMYLLIPPSMREE